MILKCRLAVFIPICLYALRSRCTHSDRTFRRSSQTNAAPLAHPCTMQTTSHHAPQLAEERPCWPSHSRCALLQRWHHGPSPPPRPGSAAPSNNSRVNIISSSASPYPHPNQVPCIPRHSGRAHQAARLLHRSHAARFTPTVSSLLCWPVSCVWITCHCSTCHHELLSLSVCGLQGVWAAHLRPQLANCRCFWTCDKRSCRPSKQHVGTVLQDPRTAAPQRCPTCAAVCASLSAACAAAAPSRVGSQQHKWRRSLPGSIDACRQEGRSGACGAARTSF